MPMCLAAHMILPYMEKNPESAAFVTDIIAVINTDKPV